MSAKPIPPTTGPPYEYVELDEKDQPIEGTEVVVQATGNIETRTYAEMKAADEASPWKKKWDPAKSRKGDYNPKKDPAG